MAKGALKRKGEVATALDVERALRERFSTPAWAFLAQVRNGTGYDRARARTADALAMSLWPSRGLELHGIEIKVDRQDVRRELNDPAKAEEFIRFCDRWWLAVSDEELVQPGELPPTWGLLVMQGGKMTCKVEAPPLEAKPLDRLQFAAILRCVAEANIPADEVRPQIEAAEKAAEERCYDHNKTELTRLREMVAEFETASGVKIGENRWDAGPVGEAVRLVLEHQHEAPRIRLARLREEARGTLALLDALAAATGEPAAQRRPDSPLPSPAFPPKV